MGLFPWYRYEFDFLIGTEFSDSTLVTMKLVGECNYTIVVKTYDMQEPSNDYDWKRVTLELDENNIIRRITCG